MHWLVAHNVETRGLPEPKPVVSLEVMAQCWIIQCSLKLYGTAASNKNWLFMSTVLGTRDILVSRMTASPLH